MISGEELVQGFLKTLFFRIFGVFRGSLLFSMKFYWTGSGNRITMTVSRRPCHNDPNRNRSRKKEKAADGRR